MIKNKKCLICNSENSFEEHPYQSKYLVCVKCGHVPLIEIVKHLFFLFKNKESDKVVDILKEFNFIYGKDSSDYLYLLKVLIDSNNSASSSLSLVTYSFLLKFLIEKYGLYPIIIPTITSSWTYKIITVLSERDNDVIKGIKSVSDNPPYKDVCGVDYSSYEEALEAGLRECLKQIREYDNQNN